MEILLHNTWSSVTNDIYNVSHDYFMTLIQDVILEKKTLTKLQNSIKWHMKTITLPLIYNSEVISLIKTWFGSKQYKLHHNSKRSFRSYLISKQSDIFTNSDPETHENEHQNQKALQYDLSAYSIQPPQ